MRKRIEKEYKNKYFDEFMDTLLNISTASMLEDFLVGILTLKELQELPLRLQIIKKLLNGESHHKIAEDLSVGVATVTRGSKELQEGRFKILKVSMVKDKIPRFYDK